MTFFIGTSFKMNKTRAEVRAYADALWNAALPTPPEAQIFVIPPFTAIETFASAVEGLTIIYGAQNCGPAEAGAFTGEVSAAMLKDLGCTLVELGHSERRAMFGETDAMVNRKVHLCLDQGLHPLICLGETAEERALGAAETTILRQARMALSGLDATGRSACLLAYEPVWAIGIGGTTATPEQAAAIHIVLKDAFPDVPVLYGGSVDPNNAAALAAEPAIDGLFIGRAALDPAAFLSMMTDALGARAGMIS